MTNPEAKYLFIWTVFILSGVCGIAGAYHT